MNDQEQDEPTLERASRRIELAWRALVAAQHDLHALDAAPAAEVVAEHADRLITLADAVRELPVAAVEHATQD